MTAGERDELMLAVQRHSAAAVISVLAIGLKEKAAAAHNAGRTREAELLIQQGMVLLDTLPTLREIGERLDSLSLVPKE